VVATVLANDACLEVTRVVELEVPVDDRNHHLVAEVGLRAGPAGLDLAGGLEQPSPLVMALPSSHCSAEHDAVTAVRGAPEAPLQSGSIWQSSEQPSKGMVLPSSQPSAPSTIAVATGRGGADARAAAALVTDLD
jgi:hypothetical protein